MKTDIRAKVNALPPVKKKEMKEKLERAGLPTVFKNVTDAAVCRKFLICSSNINFRIEG